MSKYALRVQSVEEKIVLVRGQKVILDSHLAELYDVKLKVLLQAVRRNVRRFPKDFMFQLSIEELRLLRSQFVTLKSAGSGRHRKYLPYVFTENGVAMLSSVLRSEKAIDVNILIMRAFTKMREWLATHRDLQFKIKQLERKFDKKFVVVFDAIQLLLDRPQAPVRVKGFEG